MPESDTERMDDQEQGDLFEGHLPRLCGEHRTVGPHRAWCFDCHEWCYPAWWWGCAGCRIPSRVEVIAELHRAMHDKESLAAAKTAVDTLIYHGWLDVRDDHA